MYLNVYFLHRSVFCNSFDDIPISKNSHIQRVHIGVEPSGRISILMLFPRAKKCFVITSSRPPTPGIKDNANIFPNG